MIKKRPVSVTDANGNLVKVMDPRGNSCSVEYDALNRIVSSVNEKPTTDLVLVAIASIVVINEAEKGTA